MKLNPPPFKNGLVSSNSLMSNVWQHWINLLRDYIISIQSGASDVLDSGIASLSSGTTTVSTTYIADDTYVLLTVQSLGTVTTPKAVSVTSKIDGTSFVIQSEDNTDTSLVFWAIFNGPEPATEYTIDLVYDHTLVQGTHSSFPCQLNLSNILTTYPAIKNAINIASDINVYDVASGSYVSDVYIDLDKSNNKLLIYFNGSLNDSTDKTYRVMIGYTSSINSTAVFSGYYQRAWGMNHFNNTPTTDTCLASSALLYKNSCSFGNTALFYKGGLSGLSNYATANYIPCLVSTTEFSFDIRYKHKDTTGVTAYFFNSIYATFYTIHINTTNNNLYIAVENGVSQSKWCHIDVSGLSVDTFYNIWFVVDLTEILDINKVKAYINGTQVSVVFDVSWVGLASTHPGTNDVELLGYTSQNNQSIIDFIGILPTAIDEDFIVTSANQYLDSSNFWTVTV